MKLHLSDITEKQIYDFFMSDLSLAWKGLSDSRLHEIRSTGAFAFAPGGKGFGVYDSNNVLQCIILYSFFTEICINIHIYMRTPHQQTEVLDGVHKLLYKWAKSTGVVKKIMATTPSVCVHVQKACEKHGFTLEGTLTNAMVWRQNIVDMLIYTQSI